MAHILVVDDDEAVRTILRIALERSGYTVTMAENGVEAVARFQENPSDLVITDILMPEKEGIETIRDLRRIDPNIKIIAISGGGTIQAEQYLNIAKGFGANRTVSKPFRPQEIIEVVKECLGDA